MSYQIDFGKYRGQYLVDVFENDPKYCDWVIRSSYKETFELELSQLVRTRKDNIYKKFISNNRKYKLGNLSFDTKCSMKSMVSEWLRYSYTGYLPTDDEMKWIIPLLEMHPRYEMKSVDMVGIKVSYSPPAFHFAFVKKDMSSVDISYNKCLNGNLSKQKNQVLRACRDIIRPQIKELLDKLDPNRIVCAITGDVLKREDVHMDHHYEQMPFIKIIQDFLKNEGLKWQDIEVVSKGVTHGFVSKELEQRLYEYHKSVSIIRPIHKKLNMREEYEF